MGNDKIFYMSEKIPTNKIENRKEMFPSEGNILRLIGKLENNGFVSTTVVRSGSDSERLRLFVVETKLNENGENKSYEYVCEMVTDSGIPEKKLSVASMKDGVEIDRKEFSLSFDSSYGEWVIG